MTDDEVSRMSISALKTVLFQNHVNARLMLEKSDLVARVNALLGDERHERAREAAIHALEEEEIIAQQYAMMEEQHRRDEQTHEERRRSAHAPEDDARQPKPDLPPSPKMGTSVDLERNGLCVVCQDEEANIAVVDCGCVSISFEKHPLTTKVVSVAIWQCVATAQISSCPLLESARFVVPVLSRRHDSSAYSNHNVVAPCFSLYCIHVTHIPPIDRYPTCRNLATRIVLSLLATEVCAGPPLILCYLPEALIAAVVFNRPFVGTTSITSDYLVVAKACGRRRSFRLRLCS